NRVPEEEAVEDRHLVATLQQQLGQHRSDVSRTPGHQDVPVGRRSRRRHASLRHWKSLSASARSGACASLGDRIGGVTGQVTPTAGSFQRIPRSCAALYSAVALYTTSDRSVSVQSPWANPRGTHSILRSPPDSPAATPP